MKRYLSFVILFAILASCSSPKDKLENLKSDWVKEDTKQIGKQRLLNRYQTALAYLEKHQMWIAPKDSCYEATADTLRSEPINFRVALKPYLTESTNDRIYFRLKHQWACQAFGQPLDSLRIWETKTLSHSSKETGLVHKYVSETIDKVEKSRNEKQSQKIELVSNLLNQLPSDENSEEVIIFELPTGNTIRAHMPAPYSNLIADWDSLKYQPDRIMFNTFAADEAIIFFNNQDKIERVWWGGWIE